MHRFKNHAVRRNVAAVQGGTAEMSPAQGSHWTAMFAAAQAAEIASGGAGDIIPYWIYPGEAKIERVVLMPPFSREFERYDNLKKSLATYRLAFGQPRQGELIELFSGMTEQEIAELSSFQLSLRPPANTEGWQPHGSAADLIDPPLSQRINSLNYEVDGAAYRTRTCDPLITNEVLYQLSYCGNAGPIYAPRRGKASGPAGLLRLVARLF